MFPYIFLSIINAIVIVIFSIFVFQMPVRESLFLLGLESVLFIVNALSLGILISTISKTQQSAMMISLMGLMLPVILLSGFIFPITSMPKWAQQLTEFNPIKYFVEVMRMVMLKGASLIDILPQIVKTAMYAIIMNGLAVWSYKKTS